MNPRVCKKPSDENQLPNITLDCVDGGSISLWDFRDRNNVVIFFFDPSSKSDIYTLRMFGMRDLEFADANAEVIAIADDPDVASIDKMKSIGVPFHILIDYGSVARSKLSIEYVPSVAVFDRYGMLLMTCIECTSVDAVLEDIIAELESAEMQSHDGVVSSLRMN